MDARGRVQSTIDREGRVVVLTSEMFVNAEDYLIGMNDYQTLSIRVVRLDHRGNSITSVVEILNTSIQLWSFEIDSRNQLWIVWMPFDDATVRIQGFDEKGDAVTNMMLDNRFLQWSLLSPLTSVIDSNDVIYFMGYGHVLEKPTIDMGGFDTTKREFISHRSIELEVPISVEPMGFTVQIDDSDVIHTAFGTTGAFWDRWDTTEVFLYYARMTAEGILLTEPTLITEHQSDDRICLFPQISVKSSGDAIVWYCEGRGIGEDLPTRSDWSEVKLREVNVPAQDGARLFAGNLPWRPFKVSLDEEEDIHIAWTLWCYDDCTEALYYTRRDSHGAEEETIVLFVDQGGEGIIGMAIQSMPNDDVFVFWNSGDETLFAIL